MNFSPASEACRASSSIRTRLTTRLSSFAARDRLTSGADYSQEDAAGATSSGMGGMQSESHLRTFQSPKPPVRCLDELLSLRINQASAAIICALGNDGRRDRHPIQ